MHRIVTFGSPMIGLWLAMCGAAPLKAAVVVAPATQPAADSGPLSGRVLGADQQPSLGAFVSALNEPDSDGVRVLGKGTAGPDGRFAINRLAAATPSLPGWPIERPLAFADAPSVGMSDPIQALADRAMTFRLLPATELHLTLLGPEGKPAARVSVFPTIVLFKPRHGPIPGFLLLPREVSHRWTVVTGADGTCVFRGLPQTTQIRFDTDDERFATTATQEDQVSIDGGNVIPPKTLRLMDAANVAGTVRYDDSKKPAAGIGIYAQSFDGEAIQGWAWARTNPDGHFRLARLKPGRYVVAVGSDQEPGQWTARAVQVSLAEGGYATADLTLIHGGIITGRVIDRVTSKGVAQVGVGLYGPARPSVAAAILGTLTDAQGRYAIRVPPGSQSIYISGPVPSAYRMPFAVGNNAAIEINVADGQTVTHDLILDRSDAPINR